MSRIILITGANRGLGLAAARGLAVEGFEVLVAARNPAKAQEAALSIGPRATPITLDVTSDASCAAAAGEVSRRFGCLHVLVNNAGIMLDRNTTPSTMDVGAIPRTVETNLAGPIRVTKAMLPLLRKASDPRIINVSSSWGSIDLATRSTGTPGEYAPAYQLSKAALNQWTAALAGELRSEGISVNSVCPGWCHTDMGSPAAPRTPEQGAAIIIRLATLDDPPTAGFWNDKGSIAW